MLSLIIPIYNEEELIDELFRRVMPVLEALERSEQTTCELVLVNDGSRDRSLAMMRERAEQDPHIVVVDLSRNFGHQAAIQAGIEVARGEAIAIMDGDLQDPPELVAEMYRSWKEGNKVVIAKRKSRAERGLKLFLFNSFYRVLRRMSDFPIELNAGNFSLLDKQVAESIFGLKERNRFLPGLRSWVGFKQGVVYYERDERAAGAPKMTISKLIRYAFDAIFSFSYKPLRAIWTFGFIVSALCILYACFLVVLRLLNINVVPGFTTPTVAILFVGGVQLISVGILGEYLGRIYDEVRQRPLYFIDRVYRLESTERVSKA